MRQALWLSFQVSEPGSPGAGIVKVRHASAPVLASHAATQLRVPSWPPELSPCRISSRPPLCGPANGAAGSRWGLGDGGAGTGVGGALATTAPPTRPLF